MTKTRRARKAMEDTFPSYSGPQLFNTAGLPNSIQTFLMGKGYEKFSTLIIAKALNMDGNIPISGERAMDPNGGIVPRVTYGAVSDLNKYGQSNLRFGVQGATSRIIHEVDYRVLPAQAAGHCDLNPTQVMVLEALSETSKVIQRWDSYKTDAATMTAQAKKILRAAEIIEAAGGDSDAFLSDLGVTADKLTSLVNDNDEVTV